jgi:hypothetical protein
MMMGRREFGIAGMSATALGAMQAVGAAEDIQEHAGHEGMLMDCAKACGACQRECDACSNHCATLLAEGKKKHFTPLRSCRDCADVCATAAEIMARRGYFAVGICEACADICAKCGKECAQFPDDKLMMACANECRKCEKACREMLAHSH